MCATRHLPNSRHHFLQSFGSQCSLPTLLPRPVPLEAMSEELSVIDQLKLSRRTGSVVTDKELHSMELLMESGKDLLWSAAKQLVVQAENMPFLVSYGNDATPVKVGQTVTFTTPSGHQGKRAAKQGVEVLVEHMFA
eukprot:8192180-Lingulodinium_polyedra.AAC.1